MSSLCSPSANPVDTQTLGVTVIVWTDDPGDGRSLQGCVALPAGLRDRTCPKCDSCELVGAIITETADISDPNILCKECGYWWD